MTSLTGLCMMETRKLQSELSKLKTQVSSYQKEIDRREYQREFDSAFKDAIITSDFFLGSSSYDDANSLLSSINVLDIDYSYMHFQIYTKDRNNSFTFSCTWNDEGFSFPTFHLIPKSGEKIDIEKDYKQLPSLLQFQLKDVEYMVILLSTCLMFDERNQLRRHELRIENYDHLLYITRNIYYICHNRK